jgi:hypothetical protein
MQWVYDRSEDEMRDEIKKWRSKGGKDKWPYASGGVNVDVDTSTPLSTFKSVFPMESFGNFFAPWSNQKQQEQYEVSVMYFSPIKGSASLFCFDVSLN